VIPYVLGGLGVIGLFAVGKWVGGMRAALRRPKDRAPWMREP
jgi:hypothetical protein